MRRPCRIALACLALLPLASRCEAQFADSVEVQVVDLQVSVTDEHGQYISALTPEDFIVTEDGIPQEVLDLETVRQPFSVGILLDTSGSMESTFRMMQTGARDFLSSIRNQDESFLMTFDERIRIQKDFQDPPSVAEKALQDLRFGDGTRLFDAILAALDHLKTARQPRRALFVISDGVNTRGAGSLADVIREAQRSKVLVYALILQKDDTELSTINELVESTGGSFFVLFDGLPRLQAAYEKIAEDLAHRATLYYQSRTPVKADRRPRIQVRMKNPHWRVRYQKAYYGM